MLENPTETRNHQPDFLGMSTSLVVKVNSLFVTSKILGGALSATGPSTRTHPRTPSHLHSLVVLLSEWDMYRTYGYMWYIGTCNLLIPSAQDQHLRPETIYRHFGGASNDEQFTKKKGAHPIHPKSIQAQIGQFKETSRGFLSLDLQDPFCSFCQVCSVAWLWPEMLQNPIPPNI